MTNNKILIVEDEQIIAENLRFILNEYGYEFVDVAIDAEEAMELFQSNSYDLVLMDINLGGSNSIDGIDLIKKLKETYSFVFMYVTANADKKTVDKAKTTKPAGYIVKPFVNSSIYANVEMAINTIKEGKFFLHSQKGMQYKTQLSKITYIKADGSYIYIQTLNGIQYFVRKSLSGFNDLFPDNFIRIHKSILINKNHIQAHSSNSVKVNNEKLPLGRAYKQNFLEKTKELTFSK